MPKAKIIPTARRQQHTGDSTESRVAQHFAALGLSAVKPVPDNGIDLEVRLPGSKLPVVSIQVKGRGPAQKNRKFRWFQIRTTSAQRERAISAGLPPADTWEKKAQTCDFFILVAQRFDEFWVLPQAQVLEIGRTNRRVYGNRADNRTGKQAELDLDIKVEGSPLTVIYKSYLNAFGLVKTELKKRLAARKTGKTTKRG